MADKNYDIDTLLNDVLKDDETVDAVSSEQASENRAETASEAAKKELFVPPTPLTLEEIKAEPAQFEPKTKELKQKKDKKAEETMQSIKYEQETIDIDANLDTKPKIEDVTAPLDDPLDVNYRDILGNIVKKNALGTVDFKLELENEDTIFPLDGETIKNESVFIEESSINRGFDAISMRTYTPKTAIDDTINYLFINKALIVTFSALFLINILELFIIFMLTKNFDSSPSALFFMIYALIALIPLGIGVFKYGLYPNLKIKKKFNFIGLTFNSIIFLLVCAVITFSIAFLTHTSFVDPTEFLPKIILPLMFIFDAPLGVIIFIFLTKCKFFYVNKRIIKE